MRYENKCGPIEGHFNMLTIHRQQYRAFQKTNFVHTILAIFLCCYTTFNQFMFRQFGMKDFPNTNVQFICKNDYEWTTKGNTLSQLFLTVHIILTITSVIQGESVFYSTPKHLNYFKTFTEEEKAAATGDKIDAEAVKTNKAINLEEVQLSN